MVNEVRRWSSGETRKTHKTMAHMIDTEYDRVYSVESPEWHGLANQVQLIADKEFDALSHEIKEVELNPVIDGVVVPFENHKLLVADVSKSRPDIDASRRFVQIGRAHV